MLKFYSIWISNLLDVGTSWHTKFKGKAGDCVYWIKGKEPFAFMMPLLNIQILYLRISFFYFHPSLEVKTLITCIRSQILG